MRSTTAKLPHTPQLPPDGRLKRRHVLDRQAAPRSTAPSATYNKSRHECLPAPTNMRATSRLQKPCDSPEPIAASTQMPIPSPELHRCHCTFPIAYILEKAPVWGTDWIWAGCHALEAIVFEPRTPSDVRQKTLQLELFSSPTHDDGKNTHSPAF